MKHLEWQLIVLLLISVFLHGCEFGYDPPQDNSEFGHVGKNIVLNTADRKTGIFLAHRLVYRSESFDYLSDGGGKYVVDRWLIGTYDMKSGKTKILHKVNTRDINASPSTLSLEEIQGNRVLLSGLFQHQGYNSKFSYGLLELNSNELIQLPIEAEVEQRRFSMGYVHLLNEAGDLALLSDVLYRDGYEDVRDLWIRRSTGEYNRIGTVLDFSGYQNDEIHFSSWQNKHTRTKYMIYNLKTRKYRQGTHRDWITFNRTNTEEVDFSIPHLWTCYQNGVNQLCITHKQKENWHYKVLPITVEQLDRDRLDFLKWR